MWGPCKLTTPNCAASTGLCPPLSTKDPPIKAILTREYQRPISPIVSAIYTSISFCKSGIQERNCQVSPIEEHRATISSALSVWRGTTMSIPPIFLWAFKTNSSSPLWVLAASQIFLLDLTWLNSFTRRLSNGKPPRLSFKEPVIKTLLGLIPSCKRNCSVCFSGTWIWSKRESKYFEELGSLFIRLIVFFENLALKRKLGTFLFSISIRIRGQISLSTLQAKSGFQWSRKRFETSKVSYGDIWWITRSSW